RHRGGNRLYRGVDAAVGGAAAVLDLRQREGAAARRRIVGVGVLIRDAIDQRVDGASRYPGRLGQRDGGGATDNRDRVSHTIGGRRAGGIAAQRDGRA